MNHEGKITIDVLVEDDIIEELYQAQQRHKEQIDQTEKTGGDRGTKTPKRNNIQLERIGRWDIIIIDQKIWLPDDEELIRSILYEYHDKPQVGHPGFYKTWLMVREQFHNKKLRNYV